MPDCPRGVAGIGYFQGYLMDAVIPYLFPIHGSKALFWCCIGIPAAINSKGLIDAVGLCPAVDKRSLNPLSAFRLLNLYGYH